MSLRSLIQRITLGVLLVSGVGAQGAGSDGALLTVRYEDGRGARVRVHGVEGSVRRCR